MHLFQRAFGLIRPRAESKPRGPHKRRRPLQFESLEAREVLSTSPFYISNETFSDAAKTQLTYQADQIHLAVFASNFDTVPIYYYFNKDGVATPTLGLSTLPDFLLSDLPIVNGQYVINLPDDLAGQRGVDSARIYFSMDAGLSLSVNGDGSVNAPSLEANAYYDSVEFTINDPDQPYRNLNINLTSVDQWGVPLQFKIDSTDTIDNPDHPNGTPTATTRALVVSNFQAFTQNSIFRASLDTDSGANGPYRILNPSHLLGNAETGIQPIWVSTVLQQKILTNTQTQINVASASAFPNPANGAFTVQLENEQMTVTGASPPLGDGTTNWTVLRGVNGTQAVPHLVTGKAVTQINPVITATQTTLPLGGTDGFPTPSASSPFTVVVDSEIMLVTGIAGYNNSRPIYTVQRGYDGTVATTHDEGALAYYYSAVTSPFNSYFNTAIDALFTKYHNTGDLLTLQSNGSGSEILYDGHVTTDANGVIVFQFWEQSDPSGFKFDVYYPFFENNHYFWAGYTPALPVGQAPAWSVLANVDSASPSSMVFSCNGVFADNAGRSSYSLVQQTVVADLENQMASALNRGVAQIDGYSVSSADSWLDTSQFYGHVNPSQGTQQVWNEYAQFLHEQDISIDGLNYGFAYDDKGAQSSDVGVTSFESVTLTLGAWSNTPGPGPGPGPGPDPGPAPIFPGGYSQRSFMSSTF